MYLQKHYPIKFVVISDDYVVLQYAKQLHIDSVQTIEYASISRAHLTSQNAFGVPYIRSIFDYIESHYNSTFYGYINGDIVQSSFIYDALEYLKKEQLKRHVDKEV